MKKRTRQPKLKLHAKATEALSRFTEEDKTDVREALFNITEVFGSIADPVILSFAGKNDDPWMGNCLKRTKLSDHVTLIELPESEEEL